MMCDRKGWTLLIEGCVEPDCGTIESSVGIVGGNVSAGAVVCALRVVYAGLSDVFARGIGAGLAAGEDSLDEGIGRWSN